MPSATSLEEAALALRAVSNAWVATEGSSPGSRGGHSHDPGWGVSRFALQFARDLGRPSAPDDLHRGRKPARLRALKEPRGDQIIQRRPDWGWRRRRVTDGAASIVS